MLQELAGVLLLLYPFPWGKESLEPGVHAHPKPRTPRTPETPAQVALSWLPGTVALFLLFRGRPDHWYVHPWTQGVAQGWLTMWGCA